MKTLLAGPWIGEFGWELFCWQAHIRRISKEYDKVAVACKPGHNVLYEDFANKIIDYKPASNVTNMFMCEKDHGNALFGKYDCTDYIGGHFNIGFPIDRPEMSSDMFKQQEFITFGIATEDKKYDMIIHARGTNKHGSDNRNYPIEKWNEILTHLSDKRVACIGTLDASHHIEGTEDLRGISLKELTDILRSSRMIIGPSSGPMHLATLSDCPQVVWSGSYHNKVRYEQYWNPFSVQVEYIQTKNEWEADIDVILESIGKIEKK